MPSVFPVHLPAGPDPIGDGPGTAGGRTAARLLAAAVTALLVSFLVVARSNTAFEPAATTTAAALAPGKVELHDDDEGRALFDLPALAPGHASRKCITVSYLGTIFPVEVGLRAQGAGALAPFLDMQIEMGTGGEFGNCGGFTPSRELFTGTLAQLLAEHGPAAAALDAFTVSPAGQARSFRFTFTLQDAPESQRQEANVEFLWSARVP